MQYMIASMGERLEPVATDMAWRAASLPATHFESEWYLRISSSEVAGSQS